jgi:hypothetical protein
LELLEDVGLVDNEGELDVEGNSDGLLDKVAEGTSEGLMEDEGELVVEGTSEGLMEDEGELVVEGTWEAEGVVEGVSEIFSLWECFDFLSRALVLSLFLASAHGTKARIAKMAIDSIENTFMAMDE